MVLFILGLVLFLGVHSVSIWARPWRDAQVAQRGEGAWKLAYTAVSLVGFALLVVGYGHARLDTLVLWTPPAFMRHLTMLLMLPVFPLLAASGLPGRIRTVTKHPMLLAVKIWATAHLLSNGTLVDVVLFAAFLAWAVLDRISVKRRGVVTPAAAASPARADLIAVGVGLVFYVLFVVWGHRWLIGVSPMG